MKNKLFIKCIYLCILGGFLVNLRSITMFLNVETAEMILKKGFGTSLMNMGNNIQKSLIPGLAAGFIGFMMNRQLRMWQGCLLCLFLPLFDVLFQCVLIPLLGILFTSESYAINLMSVAFNYTVVLSFSFPVVFIGLVFYGILVKDKLVVLACGIWNIGWYFLLYLLPPIFPQFNYDQLSMDRGELTRRWMLYGLSYSAIILLLFLIFKDLHNVSAPKDGIQ